MALTERSQAALFRGLSEMLENEEAVGELLSYFPSRDVDEPATRDFVDARITTLDSRINSLESHLDVRFAEMDARFAELRGDMVSAMHAEIRTMTQWTVGSIVAIVGLLLALGLIR